MLNVMENGSPIVTANFSFPFPQFCSNARPAKRHFIIIFSFDDDDADFDLMTLHFCCCTYSTFNI